MPIVSGVTQSHSAHPVLKQLRPFEKPQLFSSSKKKPEPPTQRTPGSPQSKKLDPSATRTSMPIVPSATPKSLRLSRFETTQTVRNTPPLRLEQEKHPNPTQRTPGSPQSKKLDPLPLERPCQSSPEPPQSHSAYPISKKDSPDSIHGTSPRDVHSGPTPSEQPTLFSYAIRTIKLIRL
jgi:hypothetical protein